VARILVVEDDPNNLELALRIVRHAGHEATVATDGFAALELGRSSSCSTCSFPSSMAGPS
jgi:CheY-like chemotaxis protein